MADLRLLALTHLLAAGAGFAVAPRELLETTVTHNGFFETDTKRVLSAAVASLRAQHSMVVYRLKVAAAVSIERDGFLMWDAHQDLIVPASISLLLDLSELSARDITYDGASKLVTVRLPPLKMDDVAFEFEGARTINGGLAAFSQKQVDALTKANFASARRAVVKMASDPTLVELARRQAQENVRWQFEIPLRVAGQTDVKVVAVFDES